MAAPASAEPAASAAAALASIEEAEEALYGPRESIHEAVWKAYSMPSADSHAPYFDKDGNPMIEPHPANRVDAAPGSAPFKMLSWGHLTAAVYRASKRNKPGTNKFVDHTIKRGVTGLTIFKQKTPIDVSTWIVDLSNDFHNQGSGMTCVQMMDKCAAAEDGWEAHRKQCKIKARQPKKGKGKGEEECGQRDLPIQKSGEKPVSNTAQYYKEYKNWITENYPRLLGPDGGSWSSFAHLKALVNSMRKKPCDVFEQVKKDLNLNCEFLDARFNQWNAIAAMHAYVTSVESACAGIGVEPEIRAALITEGIKFCTPYKPTSSGPMDPSCRFVPFVFPKGVDNDRMEVIKTAMEGSAVYKPVKKPKKAAQAKPAANPKRAAGGKRGRECDMAVEAMQLQLVRDAHFQDLDDDEAVPEPRQKLWIDDLVAAIEHSFSQFRRASKTNKRKTAEFVVSHALEFAWMESVTLNGKEHTKWSELRLELKRVMYLALKREEDSLADAVMGGAGVQGAYDSATALLSIAESLPQQAVPGDAAIDALTADVTKYLNDYEGIALRDYLSANKPSRPVKMHRITADMMESAWGYIEAAKIEYGKKLLRDQGVDMNAAKPSDSVDLADILKSVYDAVDANFPAEWTKNVLKLCTISTQTQSLPDEAKHTFGCFDDLSKWMRLRTHYAAHLLENLVPDAVNVEGMPSAAFCEAVEAIVANADKMATVDPLLDQSHIWARAWAIAIRK
ncbi:unnamed protein product, partial [Prorocentrum cordatum]